MKGVPFAVALAAVALDASAQPTAPAYWGVLRISPAFASGQTTIEIDEVQDPRTRETLFAVLHRTDRGRDGSKQDRWADGRTCPAVEAELAKLEQLDRVEIKPPGSVRPQDMIHYLDGTEYVLDVPIRFPKSLGQGRMSLSGNWDSSVSSWARTAMKSWSSCWKDVWPSP